jgi:glycosyltransferase involved in cell wall biosynthesis
MAGEVHGEALADALERLLRDDDEPLRLARSARETAITRYSRERMNATYEAMLLEVAKEVRHGAARATAP